MSRHISPECAEMRRQGVPDDEAYRLALRFVVLVDIGIERQTQHYRRVDGTLLRTLDEVVDAACRGVLEIGA